MSRVRGRRWPRRHRAEDPQEPKEKEGACRGSGYSKGTVHGDVTVRLWQGLCIKTARSSLGLQQRPSGGGSAPVARNGCGALRGENGPIMRAFQRRNVSTRNHKVIPGSPSGLCPGPTHEGGSKMGLEVSSGVLRESSGSGGYCIWGPTWWVGLLLGLYQLHREAKDILSPKYGSTSSPLYPQTLKPMCTLSLDARGAKPCSSMSDHRSRNKVTASDSNTPPRTIRTHVGLLEGLGGEPHPSMYDFQSWDGGPLFPSDSMCTTLLRSSDGKTNLVSGDVAPGPAFAGAPGNRLRDEGAAFDLRHTLQTYDSVHADHPDTVEWLFLPL